MLIIITLNDDCSSWYRPINPSSNSGYCVYRTICRFMAHYRSLIQGIGNQCTNFGSHAIHRAFEARYQSMKHCSACCYEVSRQFRFYIKADLQSLIYFTTTVPASAAVPAVLRKSRLLSLQLQLFQGSLHLDLSSHSTYRRPQVLFQLQHQLQYPLSLTKLKTLLSCSWSSAFSWIYCTPVLRLLQYLLRCLLSLPRSRLQPPLHLDQPSIN